MPPVQERLSIGTAGILLVSLDRHVVARAAFQRANAALFCTGDEVQELARWCAKGHRLRFLESLRRV